MISLSVAVITFNEEKNIGRCLDSVREIADDIIVVDSFSADKTREICLSRGVRFVENPFKGHIEQKNFAITQARFPYILSLDADEALSPELLESIKIVKQSWSHDGYYMNRLTNYCGKWIRYSGWYPDRKLRLWDSRKGKWGGINPHDKFEMSPGASTGYLKGDILHYSYYSVSEHVAQANRFSDIAARELYLQGKKGTWFQLVINPVSKFIRNYLLKGGILDGFYGLVICMITAHETFLKYVKLKVMSEKG
jgi:glycosyltransferase involved in cell wall biosynthesis